MNLPAKILNNFSLKKLLYNKRFTIPFSVLAAFIFWLITVINLNPTREQTFSDVPVTVTLENTVAGENGMGIVNDLSAQKFTVTVSGPNYLVSSLKADDFTVYASAAEVTAPGEYNLEVYGARTSSKIGYSIISITPSTVNVVFDYIDTKEFTITPRLIGVGAAEGLVAENPVVSGGESDTVKITGPRTIMNQIDSVAAYAEVNATLSSGQTYDAKLILYDANEKEISTKGLTLSRTTVKVSVPISKKATVSVKPTFSNMPSGLTASNVNYSVNHTSVTIIGPPDVIESITELSLSAIDFTNISSTPASFEVSATLPEGVKILDSIDFFTVSVNMEGYAEKTFTVTNTRFTGLSSGLSVKGGINIKNVKICGPAPVINALTANDLYAEINLKDKYAGEHTVTANIKSDKYNVVWQIGTYSTTVVIN